MWCRFFLVFLHIVYTTKKKEAENEKEKYLTKIKKTSRKNIRKNIQTEDGMAYLEEDVGGGSGKAKRKQKR